MRLSVSINTSREVKYPEPNSKEKPVLLNKLDEKNEPQTFNFQITGFNYTGSIQPLSDMINTWVNEKMKEAK